MAFLHGHGFHVENERGTGGDFANLPITVCQLSWNNELTTLARLDSHEPFLPALMTWPEPKRKLKGCPLSVELSNSTPAEVHPVYFILITIPLVSGSPWPSLITATLSPLPVVRKRLSGHLAK